MTSSRPGRIRYLMYMAATPAGGTPTGSRTMLEINVCVEFIRHHIERLRALHASDAGASAVEYGLVVSLIAAATVTLVSVLGGKIVTAFAKINTALT